MSKDIKLTWEWPAERSVERQLLIKIASIQAESICTLRSPSIVENLPDPALVRGIVEDSREGFDGKKVALVLPKLELGDIREGDNARLGIVDNTTCICVKPASFFE